MQLPLIEIKFIHKIMQQWKLHSKLHSVYQMKYFVFVKYTTEVYDSTLKLSDSKLQQARPIGRTLLQNSEVLPVPLFSKNH